MKYYFIGIKGAGMSALANILVGQGHEVMGSDTTSYVFTEDLLLENGVTILPFAKQNVQVAKKCDVIIQGNAFTDQNNIEVATFTTEQLQLTSYYRFLEQFLQNYLSIGISGTHGKTTTTGLLVQIFKDEPIAYLIGDGTGGAVAEADYFLFEACEYKRHFLAYHPNYLIVTNIEYDHPDYFTDVDDVIQAFVSAGNQTKTAVVAYGDDDQVKQMIQKLDHTRVKTYGFSAENEYIIQNNQLDQEGMSFDLYHKQTFLQHFTLPFYGEHMLLNTVGALVIAHLVGKNLADANTLLQSFAGVKRRFNVETYESLTLIDDYAHHPTEVRATLQAVRQHFPNQKIISIFQPHTLTRTKALAKDFILSLQLSDDVYITDIFASAREESDDLRPSILLEQLPDAQYLSLDGMDELTVYETCVIVFMGAGNIQQYAEKFKKALKNRQNHFQMR